MRHASRSKFLTWATAVAVAAAAADATAQEATGPRIRFDATTMQLPAGEHAVADLVDAGARFLGWNLLFEAAEVEAARPVELQSAMALEQVAAEEAICDLLYSRGLVVVPTDADKRIYTLIANNGPRRMVISQSAPMRTVAEILARPSLKQPVKTVLSLETISPVIATNMLRPFFAAAGAAPSGLTFGTMGANSLLLSGLQHEVAAAIRLVRKADGVDDAAEAGAAAATPAPDVVERLNQRIAALERQVAELQRRVAALQGKNR